MACQNSYGYRFMGRPRTTPRLSWHKTEVAYNWADVPDGTLCDVTPVPGCTYTRFTWPPRGRGRGESLTSPRRLASKRRAVEVIRMSINGFTWQEIARSLGFRDASGPYRAFRRTIDRLDWDRDRKAELRKYR